MIMIDVYTKDGYQGHLVGRTRFVHEVHVQYFDGTGGTSIKTVPECDIIEIKGWHMDGPKSTHRLKRIWAT